MKTWMKILMWVSLGGGIGFFAGYQVGQKSKDASYSEGYENGFRIGKQEQSGKDEFHREVREAMSSYRGVTVEEVNKVPPITNDIYQEEQDDLKEDPEMPMDPPVIDDEEAKEIPQLHPQSMVGVGISETDWTINQWNYDREYYGYYEIDEVVYDFRTQMIVLEPEQLLGPGFWMGFHVGPETVENLYFKNSTAGCIYKVTRYDAAFCDAVDGTAGPEDDEPEEDEDDFDSGDLGE